MSTIEVSVNMLQLETKGRNADVNNFCPVFRKKEHISLAAPLPVRNIYVIKSAISYKNKGKLESFKSKINSKCFLSLNPSN